MNSTRTRSTPFRLPTRLAGLQPSQIRDNMRIATEVGAINMAQGRPDFPASDQLKQAAVQAILDDHNQYSVTWGLPSLRAAVARMLESTYGIRADPETEVTITCGVTEAMVASLMATVESGDEVLIIEPAHENYVPAVVFAGATPRYVTLRPPDFALDMDAVDRAFTKNTRVVIVNTPHNPSGRVFGRAELEPLCSLVQERGALLLTDEIYDRLTYDGLAHLSPASLPGMWPHSIVCGGISKIHCVTGWRLGYVVAPEAITAAIRVVHDYTTICAPTPLQHAAVGAIEQPGDHYTKLVAEFTTRRARMMDALAQGGFTAQPPQGAYYVLASFERWGFAGSAEDFSRHLIHDVGIATVPGTAFYFGAREVGETMLRFAFAKTLDTLDRAAEQLASGFHRR